MTSSTVHDQVQLVEEIPKGLLIGGQWRESSNAARFAVEDPSLELTLAQVADATPEDGAAALDAASSAQNEWGRTPPRLRAEIVRRGFELVTQRAEDLALVMTLEMGKPLAESRGEVSYAAEFLRWFSEETVRVGGRYSMAPEGGNRLLVTKRAVGPCLLITPWNFPLAMATRKVAPAIAAGCTMILKPAALTPLSALLFASIMQEAGLPPGVLNVVPTSSAGSVVGPLIGDFRLRKLSFTGSTEVGRRLIAQAADQVLKVSMELGGNAPFMVFADADMERAVGGALLAKLRNGGEACTAANRILVERPIAAEFTQRLAEAMRGIVVGRGTQPGVELGPLVDLPTVSKVGELVDDALASGATALTGGARIDRAGYFFEPTVLTGVHAEARILHEEIFGPVAPVIPFDSEGEAVALANATPYGLVAYAFTENLRRGLRLAEELDVGMFGLNAGVISNAAAPFGGVKQSGLGREGGAEGIEEYLETRYVGIGDPYA